MAFTKSKIAVAIATAIALTGCGGGSGGGTRPDNDLPIVVNPPSNPPSNPTPPPASSGGSNGGTVTTTTYSFNIPLLTNIFGSAIVTVSKEDQQLIREFVKIFEFANNKSLDDLRAENAKLTINNTERNIDEAWTVLTGVTKQYHEEREEFWDELVEQGQYDDESAEFEELVYIGNQTAGLTLDDQINHYKDIAEGKKEPVKLPAPVVEEVVEKPIVEEVVEEPVIRVIDSVLNAVENITVSSSSPVTVTTTAEETRTSTDANGSTVSEIYKIYTDVTTITVTTTITTTTSRIETLSDGTTRSVVVDTQTTSSSRDNVVTTTNEVLLSRTVTANVAGTNETQTSTDTFVRGTPIVTTTSVDETRTSTDSNGSTVTSVYRVYTDTTTIPVTKTTTTVTSRVTTWTDGTTTSEVVDTSNVDSVTNEVTTATREELISSTVTPNVANTSDSTASSETVTRGDSAVSTTYVDDTRTTTDANGNTVTSVYRVYTDTTTIPVTTTTTVQTIRTTTWTDGTATTEVINTTSSDSTTNEVTTATREELLSQTVTPNVASQENQSTSTTTTTVSEPTLTNTVKNRDTREDGVWLFYYDTWTTTTTVVTTTVTTQVTTYTDGTTRSEVIDTVETTETTATEQVKVRIVAPDAETPDPEAPESEAGSSTVTQNNAPELDYDPDTYDAATYYNSPYMGTPTEVHSHDPADFATVEADNGAVLDVNANYAYARGWTGKGSTIMIMDSGIDTDHPEFDGKIKYEWNAGFDGGIEDINGHGTHVAGIAAANKDDKGMHGIAYDAKLAISRITDRGSGNYYALSALSWAKQYDDIVVANLSSNTVYSSLYRNAMTSEGGGIYTNNDPIYGGENYYNLSDPTAWRSALDGSEIVVTVSAGNQSLPYVQNPATFAAAATPDGDLMLGGRMLVVGNWNAGSGTIEGAKAGHVCKDFDSEAASCNDPYRTWDFYILAPGMSIKSAYLDGEYKNMSGTSMAAPVVAGAVAIVHQLWPYMPGKDIAQLLLKTADKGLPGYAEQTHGQGLLDLDQATRPVGNLGVSLTGRGGASAQLSAIVEVDLEDVEVIDETVVDENGNEVTPEEVVEEHVVEEVIEEEVVEEDIVEQDPETVEEVLTEVSAIDDFDRDFVVDISRLQKKHHIDVQYAARHKNNGWSATLANLTATKYENFQFAASENVNDYSVGYNHRFFDSNITASVSYTKSNGTSPFIDMSGMWGEVDSSSTTEVSFTYDNDFWAQVGAMNTVTDIQSGIVTDVSGINSVYAATGYKTNNWGVYAGIKPYTLSGDVTMKIPTRVDRDGNMYYKTIRGGLKDSPEGYIGFDYKYEKGKHSTTFVGIVDSENDQHLSLNYRYKF